MSRVTRTARTPLTGDPLRNEVMRLIQELSGSSNYRAANLSITQSGRDRLVLSGTQVDGTVDMTDGSPSTVTVVLNLGPFAERMESQLNSDLDRIGQQLANPAAGAGAAPATFDTPTSPGRTPRERRPYDPARAERAVSVFEGLVSGFDRVAAAISGRSDPPVDPATPSPTEVRRELHQGSGKSYGAPDPQYVKTGREGAFPWGWVVGGAAAVGGLAYLAHRVSR